MGIQAKLHVNLHLLSNLFWTKCNVCSLIVQRTFVNILTWGNRSSFPTPQSSPPLWIPERVYWWTSLYTDPCILQQTKNYVICHQLVSRDLGIVKRRLMHGIVRLNWSFRFSDFISTNQENRLLQGSRTQNSWRRFWTCKIQTYLDRVFFYISCGHEF